MHRPTEIAETANPRAEDHLLSNAPQREIAAPWMTPCVRRARDDELNGWKGSYVDLA